MTSCYPTYMAFSGTQLPCNSVSRSFLRSLDQRNISNGAAEMLKMACIKDEELFHLLEENAEDMMVSKFQVSVLHPAIYFVYECKLLQYVGHWILVVRRVANQYQYQ